MRKMNILGAAFLLGFFCNTAAAVVPNPTVIGPIPATAPPGDPSHAYPFFDDGRSGGFRLCRGGILPTRYGQSVQHADDAAGHGKHHR